jgi:hypothetical protein
MDDNEESARTHATIMDEAAGHNKNDSDLDDELEEIFRRGNPHDVAQARVRTQVQRSLLHTLPDEVIVQVLQRATDASSVCNTAATCRKFRMLCTSQGPLWLRLFQVRWGDAADCRPFEHPLSCSQLWARSQSETPEDSTLWRDVYAKWHRVNENWKAARCAVFSLEGHSGSVCDCALMGDTLITVGEDASVKWWDLEARGCNFSLERAHAAAIWSLKFLGEHVVTSSGDGTLKLWHCGNQDDNESDWLNAPMQCCRVLRGHLGREIWSCDMTLDSIFSGGRDDVARIWDRETGANYMKLESHSNSVFKICAGKGPAGLHSVLTCGGDGAAVFWDMRTGKACFTLEGDSQPIFSADVIQDDMVILAGADACASRYDLRSGRRILTFCHESGPWGGGHTDSIWGLHFNSLSNRLVTVGADCCVAVWDNLTGQSMATLRCHLEPVVSVTCDARRIFSGDAGGWIFIWDFSNEDLSCEYAQLMSHIGP